MEITKVVKHLIRRGWPNTFDNIVYIYIYIFMVEYYLFLFLSFRVKYDLDVFSWVWVSSHYKSIISLALHQNIHLHLSAKFQQSKYSLAGTDCLVVMWLPEQQESWRTTVCEGLSLCGFMPSHHSGTFLGKGHQRRCSQSHIQPIH